jgi:signal transduction histidine kinase
MPLGDLLALGTHIQAGIKPEVLLQEVAETFHRVMRSPQVYVRVRHGDTDHFEAMAFAGLPLAQQAALQKQTVPPGFYQRLLKPEFAVSDSFLIPAGLSIEPGVATAAHDTLLLLLRGRNERIMGVIALALPEARQNFLPNIPILEAIARQAALALSNARLAERSARLLAKEQLLAELGRDVSATLDLPTILARTVERLLAAFQAGSIILVDAAGNIELLAPDALPHDPAAAGRPVRQAEAMIDRVAQQGLAFFSNDLAVEPERLPPDWEADKLACLFNMATPLRACIAVPLWSGGRVIGTINVGSDQPGAFSYDDVDLLEAIAAQVGGPITSARLYDEAQRLAAQVQHRADQLTILNSLARTANASLDLRESLAAATRQIQAGFGYSHVELFLVDDETNEVVLNAVAGRDEPHLAGYRQHIAIGLIGRTVRTGQTQQVDDVAQDSDYYVRNERVETRSELCVPIVVSGRVLGLLNLESQDVAAFTQDDVAVLETAADVLAGAIENARLYHRAQAAAVLEERNRLARELHDSVTQQLFSMTLTAQAARAHIAKNPERALLQLERLQETATAALAEMRALIFQLRPPALRDKGLLAAFQQHIAALSRREGLRIELNVTGDERHAQGLEQQLFRIGQEALNNVIKHACANRVQLLLEFAADQVRMRIIDNGIGFDVTAETIQEGESNQHSRHLGLISMRERAIEIGGTMDLRSVIGGGTEIRVTVRRNA